MEDKKELNEKELEQINGGIPEIPHVMPDVSSSIPQEAIERITIMKDESVL